MNTDPTNILSLNESLIEKLKGMNCIRTSNVEDAFRAVLRHLFISGVPLNEVYQDKVFVTKEIDGKPASSCEQPAKGFSHRYRVLSISARISD